MNFIYRYLILTIVSVFTVCSMRGAVTLDFPGEASATVGIYVKDLRTGTVLAENNSVTAMLPASIMKVMTAASAQLLLPADFSFKTPVYLTGTRNTDDDSQWDGNLVIESSGDPTIDSNNFQSRMAFTDEISTAISGMGIKSIAGTILVYESMPDQGCIPRWQVDDVGWAYGAGWFGLNFNDNRFRLWPASKMSQPFIPDLEVNAHYAPQTDVCRGINSSTIDVYGPDPKSNKWVVTASMPHPAEAFVYQLRQKLLALGIKVHDMDVPTSTAAINVVTHISPLRDEILKVMMFESHNLFAEGMLRALAPGAYRADALAGEVNLWKSRKVALTYSNVVDGSGLSRANRISPLAMAQVLENMSSNPQFVALFPRVGKDGTVRNFLKDTSLNGKLVLKTGSMNAVQCYAGYMVDNNNSPTHVVVIMVNSFFCQRAELRGKLAKFLINTLVVK